MELSIVIVNWNTKDLLEKCLESVYKETRDIEFEVIVIDNASSDGSAEMVEKNYPQTNLIKNKENKGFATANNQGIKKASGDYILILNSDTVILDRALEKMCKIAKAHPEAGILGAKTLNAGGTAQQTVRRDPSLLSQLFLPSKMKKIFPGSKTLKDYYFDKFDYEKESAVPQLQGSFLLIKKEVFEKIGFFDEKFFIWFEEVDFCLRAKKAGFKILYSPKAEIIHYGGESFAQVSTLKKQGLYTRALLHFFWKNKPKWQWFVLYLVKLPILILT